MKAPRDNRSIDRKVDHLATVGSYATLCGLRLMEPAKRNYAYLPPLCVACQMELHRRMEESMNRD